MEVDKGGHAGWVRMVQCVGWPFEDGAISHRGRRNPSTMWNGYGVGCHTVEWERTASLYHPRSAGCMDCVRFVRTIECSTAAKN